ncbi:hypothetical protein [Blautia sp.]|uniref:hypothetical protein n=1 Tax=Blautia sp. TaxID=1955243 RepID=UPI003AB753B7
MEELCNALIKIFNNILPGDIFDGRISWNNIPIHMLEKMYFAYEKQSEESEINRRLHYLKDEVEFDLHEKHESTNSDSLNLSLLIRFFNKYVLTYGYNELVCRFERLPYWRKVTRNISQDIFVAAKYAERDAQNGKTRRTFTWRKVVAHNNVQLNKLLEKGISENHFHLFSSAPYFDLAWLSLMNHVKQSSMLRNLERIDRERRYPRIRLNSEYKEKEYTVQHMQAVLIRVYLYSELMGIKIQLGSYMASWDWVCKTVFDREDMRQWYKLYIKLLNRNFINTGNNLEEDTYEQLKKKYPRITWLLSYLKINIFDDKIRQENFEYFYQKVFEHHEPVSFDDCGWFLRRDNYDLYEKEWSRQTLEQVNKFLKNDELIRGRYQEFQTIIDSFLYNGKTYMNKDYAMNATDGWYEKNETLAMLSGERWLIYTMFRNLENLNSQIPQVLYDLFFGYLLIKEKFRMELLQNNDKLGFANFKAYQSRKSWFTTQYSAGEMARMAVETTIDGQNILSLELRIKPQNTFRENVKMIRRYDKAISNKSYFDRNKDRKFDNYYYVFHFSKRKDDTLKKESDFSNMYYRHQRLRDEVKVQTNALIDLRKKNSEYGQRVLGIDACSDEDGCRPEVFATAYRVLKNHTCYRGLSLQPEIPQLRATYHVGETFQDIADGLRAIDEAIRFLNLDCGDRIGHAVALGINVEKWYHDKLYTISITRQDYLDNIVWLYHKLIRYSADNMDTLLKYLETEFQLYFSLIFGKVLKTDYINSIILKACEYDKEYGILQGYNSHQDCDATYYDGRQEKYGTINVEFNMEFYYYSWMLRGDHPGLYADGFYKRPGFKKDIWDDFSTNPFWPKEKRIRHILPAVILNHYYHFVSATKKLGSVPITVHIPVNMVKGISFVQKKMQEEIAERGISIETNPSSNILISNINTYEEHPILQFYNEGLSADSEILRNCKQINVSINTDNQETFSTNLSNEYALMASGLGQIRDEDGNPVYNKVDIYKWLDDIREMGNRQSFMKP